MLRYPFGKLPASIVLATCAILSGTPATAGASEAEPIVWRLESVSRMGEYPATVLGPPRVVREGEEAALCFDGTSDAIFLPGNPIAGWTQFTIEALIKPDPTALSSH
jgi:hypothetical protein